MDTLLKRLITSDWAPVLLIWSCLLTLPTGRAVEMPTLIMAISGGFLWWRHGKQLVWGDAGQIFTLLFLCIWMPMWLSLPGAVNSERTFYNVAGFLRLYLAGLFIIWTMSSQIRRERLLALCAAIIALWVLDGFMQAIRGVDLFGFQYPPGRLNALYGERHLDFGPALATLSPLLLEPVRRRSSCWLTAIVFMGLTTIVFLAGSRGAWISFALASSVSIYFIARQFRMPLWTAAMGVLVLIGLSLGFAQALKPDASSRLNLTLKAFQADSQSLDEATSGRKTIWSTSVRMIADNPINGVGVSGYRHAYPAYAQAGDPFVDLVNQTGPSYSHQILLDVASGAGLIGIAGLVAFYFLLMRLPSRVPPENLLTSIPFLLAAGAWLFPLNAHPHFYSSQWSQLIWWLLAIACAAATKQNAKPI